MRADWYKDSLASNQWLSFTRVDINEGTLLGAPLFHRPALDKSCTDRCDDLARGDGQVGLYQFLGRSDIAQVVILCGDPEVMYLMRTSPSVSHPCLQTFDASSSSSCDVIGSLFFGESLKSDSAWDSFIVTMKMI